MLLRLPALPFGFATAVGDMVVQVVRVAATESETEGAEVVIGNRRHTLEPWKQHLIIPQSVRYAAMLSHIDPEHREFQPMQLTRWLRSPEDVNAAVAAGVEVDYAKYERGSVKYEVLGSLSVAPGVELA